METTGRDAMQERLTEVVFRENTMYYDSSLASSSQALGERNEQ